MSSPLSAKATAEKDVLGALSTIIDPDFGMDIVACGFVKDMEIDTITGKVCMRIKFILKIIPSYVVSYSIVSPGCIQAGVDNPCLPCKRYGTISLLLTIPLNF